MGKGKLLIAGIVVGVLAIFAFIGVKSILGDRKLVTQDTGYTPTLPQGTGTPIAGTETGTGIVSPSTDPNLTTQDIPLPGNTTNPSEVISLEGETEEPKPTTNTPSTETTQAGQLNAGTGTTQTGTGTATPTATVTPTTETTQTSPTTTTPTTTDTTQAGTTTTTLPNEVVQGALGKLGLTIIDTSSPNGEIDGEFLVYDTEGVQVASFSRSETSNFSLPPGKYLAKVKANGKEASRLLEVYADKFTNARFEMPTSATNTNTATQQQAPSTPVATNSNGQVYISVRAGENNRALRSNIYVQKQNGQHVAKSNYANGAEFSLEPGAYKITVKAEGRQEVSRNIQVSANGIVRETISLPPTGNVAAPPQQSQQVVQPIPQAAPVQQGLLRLRLNSGQGLPDQARFVIRNQNGERVATVGPAPNGEINLPAGTYEVTAGIQGLRQSRVIEVGDGRVSDISFDATEIIGQTPPPVPVPPQVELAPAQQSTQAPPQPVPAVPAQQNVQQNGGRLKLYAISGVDRQPMRVNFRVTTLQGQPIQSFSNVSSAEIRVPPQSVQVQINYQTMNGTEVINVLPDQPTEYTFTISPNN